MEQEREQETLENLLFGLKEAVVYLSPHTVRTYIFPENVWKNDL